MDTRSGEIISESEAKRRNAEFGEGTAILVDENKLTPRQKKLRKVGRNELCPCGSGRKFKRCHMQWRPDYEDELKAIGLVRSR